MARILLTEDDDAVRAFVRRALEIDGHDVTPAEDGGVALEVLQRGERFDLLLSDIMMPVMDGIGLALNVARDFPDLPILLMTGFADQRERAQNLEAIVFDVVPKPFTLAEIRKAVREALTAHATGRLRAG
ncbi:response regulator [Methylobrevis pamukkalensis]|uniref:Response regulator MprA n=1 Tax=Methylobrevis pamukkalensis TaxID=1439726 RepID=A0A1E3GX32_9HYPH|nr:response regulator [Methylobrevis pamukkalensis]ODN68607.1 Response regulator MprA [Methylobrevis pamukkalensis]